MMVFTVIGMITLVVLAVHALASLWTLTLAGHINRPRRFTAFSIERISMPPGYRFYRIIGWDSLNFYVSFRRDG